MTDLSAQPGNGNAANNRRQNTIIDEFIRRADLADRGVFLHLPPITPKGRREESELRGAFREAQPRIFGGLLDALAAADREFPSVQLDERPRMADFARFSEAVGRGLGWPAGAFVSAYLENRREASDSSLEDSAVASKILEWAEQGILGFTFSPADLLKRLTARADKHAGSSGRWPKTPTKLGNELRRLAPQLRERSVFITFSRTGNGRRITIKSHDGSDDDDDDRLGV